MGNVVAELRKYAAYNPQGIWELCSAAAIYIEDLNHEIGRLQGHVVRFADQARETEAKLRSSRAKRAAVTRKHVARSR